MFLKQVLLFSWHFAIFLSPCESSASNSIKFVEDRDVEEFFKEFQEKYDKNYAGEEEYQNRLKTFADNFYEVERHNQDVRSKWKKGINAYSDLSKEEFDNLYLKGINVKLLKNIKKFTKTSLAIERPPPFQDDEMNQKNRLQQKIKNIDWRLTGAISPVKDQGKCGSCWAFAAVQEIESYVHIATGQKTILSSQQVSSCAKNGYFENWGGCNGSWPEFAFSYSQLFGVVSEESYPYHSGDTMEAANCEYDPNSMGKVATIRGYQSLPQNDVQPILDHLTNKGPLSALMYASTIKDYESGVFDGCSYNESISVNHAVQLVGYGTHPFDGDFWIVRNSWSEDWGDKGYIKLKREKGLECGCYMMPENEEDECFTICGMCGIVWWNTFPIGANLA